MATLITDPSLSDKLIAQRRENGADRWDETWEGVYMMTPMPNDEHQDIVGAFNSILRDVVQTPGKGCVRPGVNITDQEDDWTNNYRCPDVVVYFNETDAICRDTHWFGGPDFLVEVISPDDRTREKLDFYGKIGTREALLVDRDPWALELWRLEDAQLKLAATSTLDNGLAVTSDTVGLSFQLIAGEPRPVIQVACTSDHRSWRV